MLTDAMGIEDLHRAELLQLDPDDGAILFAGQRVLLIDAVAMGLLRKYLVENFGVTAARTVLTQFGFAHGWRMAESIRGQFSWDSAEKWRSAGPRLHTLEGLFRVQSGGQDPLAKEGTVLSESYEAEQHLLHFGRSESPACWTITGLISGYLSQVEGKQTYVLEHRCAARGDAACHMVARSRDQWGEEHLDDLLFFDSKRLHESLEVSLQRVVDSLKIAEKKLQARRRRLRQVAPEVEEPLGIVARSAAMREVVDLARRMARVDSTVLITGESGVGKERVARLIHEESSRSVGPLVAVNCGAVPETLLESELFGYKRGAFTGATQDRAGLFEAANGGTLFLDEIGDISASMQVKLLRVLQEREIRRVGDTSSRAVNVRVLAATNRDLVERIAEGEFRSDLYYRLRVVEIHVPPLVGRRSDVLILARLLLAEAALRMKRDITGLTPAAADQLLRYSWPGNVRELENAMEHAVALARGTRVELEDLPEEVREAVRAYVPEVNGVRPMREVERDHILAALDMNDGNQTRTAKQLGIGSATLYRKLKSYGRLRPSAPSAGS